MTNLVPLAGDLSGVCLLLGFSRQCPIGLDWVVEGKLLNFHIEMHGTVFLLKIRPF